MYQAAALRDLINKTLTPLGLWSPAAEELLMATCAQESHLGVYRQQIHGPALGIFQMEPATHDDIWNNYLAYHTKLGTAISNLGGVAQIGVLRRPDAGVLVNNDPYAIAMCRVHYLRVPGVLPASDDLAGLWGYYKQWYNTPKGAATQLEFVSNYRRYVVEG